MMEYSNFLSGSDNLFKYLFTIGLSMVVFSLIFPLQKKQEIELQIISYNKEVSIINNEILLLKSDIDKLAVKSDKTVKIAKKLQKIYKNKKSKVIANKIQKYKLESVTEVDSMMRRQQNIDTKVIISEYEKKRILTLEDHSNTYKKYFFSLLIIGSLLSFIGLVGWSIFTYLDIKIKRKEL